MKHTSRRERANSRLCPNSFDRRVFRHSSIKQIKLLKNPIRIATRKSPLAMWQAEFVAEKLQSAFPGLAVVLVPMTTRGDRILDAPLAKVGGKGLFVKELEQGILRGDADLAVHSMKDVPVEIPSGLCLGAILEREDPRDALVSNRYNSLAEIPKGAVIGTSSLRRQMQFRARHPDCEVLSLRGNVNTRLQKLDEGQFDAILLAASGLARLGLAGRIREWISIEASLPAIGQGAIGVECREDDVELLELLAKLHHEPSDLCVRCERSMNARLHGGCQVPIAGYAELKGPELHLRGLVGEVDGRRILRAELQGRASEPEALGIRLAEQLLADGAQRILEKYSIESHAG